MPRARGRSLLVARRAGARRRLDPGVAPRRRRSRVPHVDPARTAALAVDLRTGAVVFARNATLSLVPASNEKLPVAYAALALLGPGYRFHTEVVGSGTLVGDVWHGDLWLRGFGDPTLGAVRPRRARGRGRRLGDPARRRRRDRGRVLVRRAPDGARLEGRASTSTSRRRSRRSSSTAAGTAAGRPHNPALAAGSLLRQALEAAGVRVARPDARRRADDRGPAARAGRLRAARRDRPLHGPRERQLHRRDARQAARGALRRRGHDRRRDARDPCRARRRRACRSPASGSPTAPGSPGSTA